MKKIVVLDTWVNDTNLGNKIIMDAVVTELHDMFPDDFLYHVPALEYITKGRYLLKQAEYSFFAGTNILTANMNKENESCMRLRDTGYVKDIILFGVGWWQYQDSINYYSRLLYSKTLNKKFIHSVRDSYTVDKLQQLGIKAINTGCPSLWCLTEEKCKRIPHTKGKSVLLTFTEYNQKPEYDIALYKALKEKYDTIYFWAQQFGDYEYAKQICGDNLIFINSSTQELDKFLSKHSELDYCGTRLHCGIRCMQYNHRSIIIAVDNRATEMGTDFNLPVVQRTDIVTKLGDLIDTEWVTDIKVDHDAISIWKSQFK